MEPSFDMPFQNIMIFIIAISALLCNMVFSIRKDKAGGNRYGRLGKHEGVHE